MPATLSSIHRNLFELSYRLKITKEDLLPLCLDGELNFSAEFEKCSTIDFQDLTLKQLCVLIILNSIEFILPNVFIELIAKYDPYDETKIINWNKVKITTDKGSELYIDLVFIPMYGYVFKINLETQFDRLLKFIENEQATLIYHYNSSMYTASERPMSWIKPDNLSKFNFERI